MMKLFAHSSQQRLGLFVLLFIFPGFFLPLNDGGGSTQAWQQTMDLAHFAIFALIAWLLLTALHHRLNHHPRLIAGSACLALMLSIEAIQPLVGRSASLDDILYGVAGCVLILVLDLIKSQMQGIRQRLLSVLLIVTSCTVVAFDTVGEWSAVYWRYENFPLLANFESDSELRLWKVTGQGSIELVDERAGQVLKVETATGNWSGVNYQAGNMDWSAYHALQMQIDNPGPSFGLSLRIDDSRPSPQYKERANRRFQIYSGMNTLNFDLSELFETIPSGDFDVTEIRRVHLFVGKDAPKINFYLDNVLLK